MKKRKLLISSLVTASCLFAGAGVFCFDNNQKAVAEISATPILVEDVDIVMKNGASVRYASSATNSGLRFTAGMPASDYLGLEANEGIVYESVKYGVAIMPYEYIERFGALTEETLFGEKAVYDWAILNAETGEWEYSGDNTTRKRIMLFSSNIMAVDQDEPSNYIVSGSISGILQDNLARDFVGLGYIEATHLDGTKEYRMAEYANGNIHNNVRSIVEVAEKAVADPELTDEGKINALNNYYINATDVRRVKFYDGSVQIGEVATEKSSTFSDTVTLPDTDDWSFAYWVDENGERVTADDTYEIVGTTKLYAVYSKEGVDYVGDGYLGETGKVATAINEFLSLSITETNIEVAQEKLAKIKELSAYLRSNEYVELIDTETQNSIDSKVAEMNAIESNPLYAYENYTGTLYSGADLVDSLTVTCATEGITAPILQNNTVQNGAWLQLGNIGVYGWTIALPLMDYSALTKVMIPWQSNYWCTIGAEEGSYITRASVANTNNYGTITVVLNADETLTVTIVNEASNSSKTVTVNDSDIINGRKALSLYANNGSKYHHLYLGEISVSSLYNIFEQRNETLTLYSGENLVNGVSIVNASTGNKPNSVVASALITDGVQMDPSATQGQWKITLPVIEFSLLKTVSFAYKSNTNYATIGFMSGAQIQNNASALNGTVTITNNGDSLTVVISDTTLATTITETITDSDVISGKTGYTFFYRNGAGYRQFAIGPITASYNELGKFALAEEAGATPKDLMEESEIVNFSEYTSNITQYNDGTTVYECYSGTVLSTQTMQVFARDAAKGGFDGGLYLETGKASNYNWKIYLPKINFSNCQTVSFKFKGSADTLIVGFEIGQGVSVGASEGAIVITNAFNGTLTATVTYNGNSVSTTITDKAIINGESPFFYYVKNMANYRNYYMGPISAVKVAMPAMSETVETTNAWIEQTPFIAVDTAFTETIVFTNNGKTNDIAWTWGASGVNEAGEEIIGQVNPSGYTQLGEGTIYYAVGDRNVAPSGGKFTIALPKLNYSLYNSVSYNWQNGQWNNIGFTHSDYLTRGTTNNGTLVYTNNGDGTLTVVLTNTATSSTRTLIVDDAEIVYGKKCMTIAVSNGAAHNQFYLSAMTGERKVAAVTTKAYEYLLKDFSASTYEVTSSGLDDEQIKVSRVSSSTPGSLDIQTQNDSTGQYSITLPWINYAQLNYVTMELTHNNATNLFLTPLAAWTSIKDTSVTLKVTTLSENEIQLTATPANGGTVLTKTITDADVINGRSGLTFYAVSTNQYTQIQLHSIYASGRPDAKYVAEAQELNLAEISYANVAAYRILYNVNDGSDVVTAATELQYMLQETTGLQYIIVPTNKNIVEEGSKYIVLGSLAEENSHNCFDLTQETGYNIKQDYTNLYVYGSTDGGTLKGVYGLMQTLANFEFFTNEVYSYDYTGTLTVESGYSYAFNPSFDYSITAYSEAQWGMYNERMGMDNDFEFWTGAGLTPASENTSGAHTMMQILPYETYGTQYSEWYCYDSADTGSTVRQLNFSKTENTSYATMLNTVVESAKSAIEANTDREYFLFTTPDSLYAPNTAEYIVFMNELTEQLDAWLAANYPTRKVQIAMFAYNGTLEAPSASSLSATSYGTAENPDYFYNGSNAQVRVIFAPVGARYPLKLDDALNQHKNTNLNEFTTETIAEFLSGWVNLGANLDFWLYGTDYSNYFMPMDTITNMQYNFQLLSQYGDGMMNLQLQTYSEKNVGSDWQRLKTYLSAKLANDVNADVATLQANFMDAMYGAGANAMQALLSAQQAYCTYDNFNGKDSVWNSKQTENYFGVINGSIKLCNSDYFDEDTLNSWMGYINSAKAAVNADTNLTEEAKAAVIERIEVEALAVRYLLISLHGVTTYDASVEAWETHAATLGCLAVGEND